jgi:hypothetical protein
VEWLRYFASAVIVFQLQPSEAWLLSPQEYWALYDFKMDELAPTRAGATSKDAPKTKADIVELEQHLIDMGKL